MDLKAGLNPVCSCNNHARSCFVCLFRFENVNCDLKIVSKFEF